jgi:hypothetical protein
MILELFTLNLSLLSPKKLQRLCKLWLKISQLNKASLKRKKPRLKLRKRMEMPRRRKRKLLLLLSLDLEIKMASKDLVKL